MARFVADTGGLALGMVVGVITARWLGPAGKGLLSTITFLSGIVMQICALGLGDAAIVRVGQRKNSLQEVLSASLAVLIPAAFVAAFVMWAASMFEFRADWAAARIPVFIACIGLPVSMLNVVSSNLLNSQERFVSTSSILLTSAGVTAAATWLVVVHLHRGTSGAVIATIAGAATGAILNCGLLLRGRLSFRPRADRDYLRFALSYGPRMQLSQLLVTVAVRFDLLVVYALAGQASAGQYSVALTAAGLGGMLPISLVIVAFPRLASLPDHDSAELAAKISRYTIALSCVSCALLAVAVPLLLPLAFGRAYSAAIVPALVLLGGPLIGSAQYHLCRAWAARGDPSLLFRSYGLMSVIMIALDFVLIPRYGLTGAAVASLSGNIAGWLVCLRAWRATGRTVSVLLPRAVDFQEAVRSLLALLARKTRSQVVAQRQGKL